MTGSLMCIYYFCFIFQRVQKEFDEFENLFGRFLRESGPSVEWDKLKLLAPESVSTLVKVNLLEDCGIVSTLVRVKLLEACGVVQEGGRSSRETQI